MKLPVGVDDYKKLIQQSYDHVDKSLFIKAFLDENAESTLITRPRRFGKTLNMSMLYYFFSNQNTEANRQLFVGKKIEAAQTNEHINCMDLQGQFPTIFLTFKNVRPDNFEEAKQQIAFKISELCAEHAYLSSSMELSTHEKEIFNSILNESADHTRLQYSLETLSKYLFKHHKKKVIILLDEYDTPFHAAYANATPFHEEISNFMKIFLGSAFKGNLALEKAMITGILRVSLMDLFSGANSIPVRSMLIPKYQEFFGFTEDEAQSLIIAHATGLPETTMSARIGEITQWYNGYRIGATLLYNPWSIISYLDLDCTANIYWNASGEDSVLGRSLLDSSFNMKDHLVRLLNQGSLQVAIDERTVFADLSRNEGALWGLMLYSGYLKVTGDNGDPEDKEYQVAIPNLEVKQAYKKMVRDWFISIGESAYHQLFNSLQAGNLTTFELLLKNYLDQTVSYHDLGKKTLEKVYHVMFLGMFFMLGGKYTVDSNKEYGLGRYDIILIPKDKTKPGYIFEFKATDNARKLGDEVGSALSQITESRYSARLQQEGITRVHHVGIAFCGKEMHMGSEPHSYLPSALLTSNAALFNTGFVNADAASLDSSSSDAHKDKKPRIDGSS
jgi:hypothetical protein